MDQFLPKLIPFVMCCHVCPVRQKWRIEGTTCKPLDALRFLKAQNPLYCDIEINDQWFEEAVANDDELGMCLVEQNDETMDTESDQPETENEPTSDELSLALKYLALENGFTIYDVP